jgi:glyoxylase-like metal-dependent hydrolase (beta-lactamase superfamily II)
MVIDGAAAVSVGAQFKIIPTPGHTRGHCVLLFGERFLFTGDHLWWEPEAGTLGASRNVCWYSWPEQTASMRRLLVEKFEWVLPGHGDRGRLPADAMHSELTSLVGRMQSE